MARHMKVFGGVVLGEENYFRSAALNGLQVIAVILLADLCGIINGVDDLILHMADECSGSAEQQHIAQSVRSYGSDGHAAFGRLLRARPCRF